MNVRLLTIATLFAAGCGGNIDGSGTDDEAFNPGSIGVINFGPLVTIDSFDPATPVDGRRTVVHFTLDNFDGRARTGRVAAIVSPVASSPFEAPFSFRVDQVAASGRLHGVIAFDAPLPSRLNDLSIFFEDGATKVRNTATHQSFDVAGRYSFEVDTVKVDNPRSPNTDTDYLGFAALDPHGNVAFARATRLGDGGSGHDFPFPLTGLDPIDVVPDTGAVTLGTLVLNQGRTNPPPGQVESMATQYVQGTLHQIDLVQTGWWDAIPLWPLFDCDGVVVADRRAVTGRELADGVIHADPQQKPRWVWSVRFPFHGFNSPGGCGAVSNYEVVLGAVRVTTDHDVVVNPAIRGMRANSRFTFSTRNSEPVDWSVDGGAINGYIDGNGTFTMPSSYAKNTLITIRATARDGSGRTGVAYVSLDPTAPPFINGVFH